MSSVLKIAIVSHPVIFKLLRAGSDVPKATNVLLCSSAKSVLVVARLLKVLIVDEAH